MNPITIKTTVLLADDHALVRAGIHNALVGMAELEIVGEVGDGRSLRTALANQKPDCLLIDVTMPHFDPIPDIRLFHQQYPDMKILVVSAYDDDVYVQGLLGIGVNGYHLKDQPLSDLRLAIKRILAGQRWISSTLVDKLLQPSVTPPKKTTLSARQNDLLQLLVEGLDNRSIAQRLNLSVKTVENHLTRLYRQINVQSRLEAANYGRNHPELLVTPTASIAREPIASQMVVLVVDDNRRYRSQLKRMIGKVKTDATLYEAENTETAVSLAKQTNPSLILVDVALGDENGIDCARQLKQHSSQTRIILISAYPDQEFHRQGLKAGATAFVDKKNLDSATLRQILDDIFQD